MPWLQSARNKPRRPDWLTVHPFAHRGLHGAGRPENSRAAFEAAIEAGFGIELDVRASACGTPFVFHDETLDRLCNASGPLAARDANTLAAIRLKGSSETISSLADILRFVAGRVPLLVEVKTCSANAATLTAAVVQALSSYTGPVAIMSFDPRAILWLRRGAPQITRGLVISEEGSNELRGLIRRTLAAKLTRPDFLAYDIASLPSPFAARARARGMAILAWTVRTEQQGRLASVHADQIIHEMADF